MRNDTEELYKNFAIAKYEWNMRLYCARAHKIHKYIK